MSGGHFHYAQSRIRDIADELENIICTNDEASLDEWGCRRGTGFTPETIAEFRKGLHALREAYVYAQRIDWLVSADDSEESFRERLASDLANISEAGRQ